MNITHRTKTSKKTGTGTGLFLLANNRGGYAFFGNPSFSHFTGMNVLFPDDWSMVKFVDDISLDLEVQGLVMDSHVVRRTSGSASESFAFFGKTLYYRVDEYTGTLTLDLDIRRLYDSSTQGRVYKVYKEAGSIIVEYTKFEDNRCLGVGEKYYLIITGARDVTLLDSWIPRTYEYDMKRAEQSERWVYRALRLQVPGELFLTITAGRHKDSMIRESRIAWDNRSFVMNQLSHKDQSTKSSEDIALHTSKCALEHVVASTIHQGDVHKGVLAGYPWFFHYWARDELICVKGLLLAQKYSLVKEILLHYVALLGDDGRIPNMFPSSTLGSADAVLWLWKQLGECVLHLEERKLLWKYFCQEELLYVSERIEFSLSTIKECYEKNGLITNGAQETWMDTRAGVGDVRAGARIEIQSLVLASIQTSLLLNRLLGKNDALCFGQWEQSLKDRVKLVFYKDGYLYDGQDDPLIRPNAFIAAYAYPDLLSKEQWVCVFSTLIDKLWLDWGGFSSIDKTHMWFCPEYDPRNDKSYHRGDSWFWVNHLAALALHRIAPQEYAKHVQAVVAASTNELLWQGVVGHVAELSSASHQTSEGCLAQAWSAATLLELLDELRNQLK